MKKPARLVFALTVPLSTLAVADQYEVCKSPIMNAAVQSFEQFTLKDNQSFYYERKCGSHKSESNNDQSAMVDAIIDSVPIGINIGSSKSSSSEKKWCDENSNLKRDNSFYSTTYTTIFAPALTSFNSCIAAMNSRLVLSISQLTQDQLTVRIRNADNRNGNIQGVVINPKLSASCSAAYDNKVIDKVNSMTVIPFKIGMTILFDCIRNLGVDQIYPQTSFVFRNDIGEVTYVMPKYDANKPDILPQPKKHLQPMNDVVVAATAYWAGKPPGSTVKGTYFVKQCFGEPSNSTFVGTRITKTHTPDTVPYCLTAADFQGNTPCTGRDEVCTITEANGCYVSTEWLEWYKDSIRQAGLRYSESQICAEQPVSGKESLN